MAQSDSDEFELVDSLEVAQSILADKKPDLAKIRSWLAPTKYTASSSEFNRHLSSQAPGTGEWIRETSQFQQWHASADHASIWIKAVPGAGKSVVAASMVNSLAQKESVPVLYFFFRQIIETNRTSRALLRDFLAQLLAANEVLQVSLWDIVDDGKALATISTEQLWRLLLSALRNLDRAYIVVDALDEMDLDQDFLSLLNALGSFRPAHVKVLMTSRPKQYLQRAMKDPQVIHVSLEEELVKRDVSVFVRQRISRFSNVSLESKALIHTTVCTRSEGLFLYARLILDQVAKSIDNEDHDQGSIRDMVVRLPCGLEDMYNKMLMEHAVFSRVDQDVQILILQLVTQSARPLRLIEIAKAIETSHFDLSRDSKDIVRTACGPLLEIMEDEVVQIIHHSFTEFLLDSSRLNDEQAQFPVIDPTIAHRSIAKTCLDRCFGQPSLQSIFLQYPLAEYAVQKWTYHAKHYDVDDVGFFTELERFCDLKKPCFYGWLSAIGQTNERTLFTGTTPLHVAAAFGLNSWAKHLINAGASLDELDATRNTALFWAATAGHTEVASILVKAGANPDVDGRDGTKPLHAAASRNHAGVVKVLLAAGVSPITPKTRDIGRWCGNAPTSVGHSPLRYASQAGHIESVVAMLPFVTESQDLEDALCWAAKQRHSRLLAAILENSKVSPDGRLKIREESCSVVTGGETALILAAGSLDSDCVRILLDRGADATKRTLIDQSWKVSSLQHDRSEDAAEGGGVLHSLAVVRVNKDFENATRQIFSLLVAAGAELEAKDHRGNTPLQATIARRYGRNNNLIVVELLLAAGADPFVTDNNGASLLHNACGSYNTDVVKKLLDLKVNPSLHRHWDGATPLHRAVANTHCPAELIKLLVDHGADVDAVDNDGNTALMQICNHHSANTPAIGALLELGANVNVQNKLSQTCLHLFHLRTQSCDKAEQELENIIEAGADLELCDREGKTVLLNAVEKSNEAMVKALLQYSRPFLNARTYRRGKSALHLACHARSAVEMIQTLVDHHADVTWTDNEGNTLLHEVATRFQGYAQDISLVKNLISLGVPTSALNCRRRTALHVMPCSSSYNPVEGKPTRQTMVSVLLRLVPKLDVNVQDIDGYTPLHLAAAASEAQTSNLLQAGARIDIKAFKGETPLHCAARARQSGIVSMLLMYGNERSSPDQWPGINATDNDGFTPLHYACRSGRPESVKLLLDAGADVHQEDSEHRTPLRVCAEFMEEDKLWSCLMAKTAAHDEFRPHPVRNPTRSYGSPSDLLQYETARIGPIVAMLLEKGAKIENIESESTILDATRAGSTAMVNCIRKHSDITNVGFEETSILYTANNAAKVLDSYKGDGPIQHPAAFVTKIDEATMDVLVSRQVNFADFQDDLSGGSTAFNVMAAQGLTEKMRKVVVQAKVLNEPKFWEAHDGFCPPLHDACDRPLWNMEMLKLLVVEGQVNVNAHRQFKERVNHKETGKFMPGPTALHVLAGGDYWWQIEAIKFLIEHGAQVDCLDRSGQTPLNIASTEIQHGSGISKGFFRPQCCEALLKLGANPNRPNKKGLVPLNLAGSDEDIIKVLLRNGAEVNAGIKGVLISAVEIGDDDTLRIYLENGADCNIPDTSPDSRYSYWDHGPIPNRYPLLLAALLPWYSGPATSTKMLDLLLNHGAKVDLPLSDDQTLLHYIFQHATTATLRPLIDRPGIDFNIKDQKGRTVFMAACESNVTWDSDRNTDDLPTDEQERLKAEYTPPYLALANSEVCSKTINYLTTDNQGKTILNYLLPNWGDTVADQFLSIAGVRDLICQKDKAGFSLLHHALKALKEDASRRFVDEGNADLVEPDPKGDTALHHLHRCEWRSSLLRFRPLMDRYLQLGGDINARNESGETALHAFVAYCKGALRPDAESEAESIDPFEFFISNGADFKAVKNNGQTALHVVAMRAAGTRTPVSGVEEETEQYSVQLFRRLVSQGCDPLQEDQSGRTALDVAAGMGNENILRLYQRKKT